MDEIPIPLNAPIRPMSGFWIKSRSDILVSRVHSKLPDTLWRRFQELNLLLRHDADSGYLPPVEDIAFELRLDLSKLQRELDELLSLGLIERENDRFCLPNFIAEQAADSAAQRKAHQRERDRTQGDSHEKVTSLSQIVTQKEIDKETEKTEKTDIPKALPSAASVIESDGDGFNEFWKAYPKKRNREGAESAWREMKASRPPIDVILKSLSICANQEWATIELKYIPAPAKWISEARWEEHLPKPKASNHKINVVFEEKAFEWRAKNYRESLDPNRHPTWKTYPTKDWPRDVLEEFNRSQS